VVDIDTKFHVYLFFIFRLAGGCDFTYVHSFHCHWAKNRLKTRCIYSVIQNDCWGFNNLSHTIHLR